MKMTDIILIIAWRVAEDYDTMPYVPIARKVASVDIII